MINTPINYGICQADVTHLPFLNSIEMAAATIFPPGFLPAHVLLDKVPLTILREAMEQSCLWVVLHEGRTPVGYALFQARDGATLLAQLDVHPDQGRKGLGAALVNHVIGEVKKRDLLPLYLTTFANIRWNAPFYSKLGFLEIPPDDQPDFIRAILQEEQRHGLDNRIAMRYHIDDIIPSPYLR